MSDNTLKDPQIFISQEARSLFDNLKRIEEFKCLENKDLFMLALLFGINKDKIPIKKQDRTQSGFTRERYLSDKDMNVLKAIAVSEKDDISIINDIPGIFSLAEEYANAGIKELKEFVYDNPADLTKKLSSKIKKALK